MLRKELHLAFALILTLIASGCAPTAAPTLNPTAPAPTITPSSLTVTDAAGNKVTINGNPERVISLAPSDTEILFALGAGPKLLAVDDFSDYPAEAKALPKVGGTNDKYNFEQIVALKPDVVFASGITSPDALKKLQDLKLTVVLLGPEKTTLDSIMGDIMLAGQVMGRADQAKQLTDSMKQRVAAVRAKAGTAKTKPRVYWELDATDPTKPYTVGPGAFVDDIITLVGGVNVFANASSAYPQVSAEQVVAANPEVIILSDAAYGITVDSVLQRPGWQTVDAIKNKHVYPIDDSPVSRPGPRIVDGIEAAAKLIHPELF